MQLVRVPQCQRGHGLPEQFLVFDNNSHMTDLDAEQVANRLAQAHCGRCNGKMVAAPSPVLSIPPFNISSVISELMGAPCKYDRMDFGITDFAKARTEAEGNSLSESRVLLTSGRQPQYAIELRWAEPRESRNETSWDHAPELQMDTVPHLLAKAIDRVLSNYGFRATQRGKDGQSNWIYLELWMTQPSAIRVRAKITWPVGG